MSNLVTSPELTIIDGIAFCTSLQVSDHFEKRHDHVLRDIEATITQVIENLENPKSGGTEKFFQKATYTLTNNLGHKVEKPMYLLTRDGFTLLAMSYSGAKAMQFKLAYMQAFNRMETALKYQLDTTEILSRDQLHEIERRIQQASQPFHMKESARQWMQNLLRFHLNVSNLPQIKAADYPKALLLLEQIREYSDEYLDLRVEQEKLLMREYLGQGLPFTGVLRREFSKTFQQRLPDRPNWQEVAAQLAGRV